MLKREIEYLFNFKIKCDMYWNENTVLNFGDIELEMNSESEIQ